MTMKLKNALIAGILLAVSVSIAFSQPDRTLRREGGTTPERRTALVIGNGDYQHARKLPNPVNDASDMAAALREMDFEVISGTDQNLKQLTEKVREFGDRLKVNGGVGLFYYAGHGVQVGGRNYMIPVDGDIPREDEIEFKALNVDMILRKMATADNGLNIVILDACRDNPFSRSWRSSDNEGGLAQISAPTGTFIAYATSPNAKASDGEGRNGLYTSQLLRFLKRPNLKIEEIFKEVRKAVDAASQGKQIPWDSSSLRGEFYFAGQRPLTVSSKTDETSEVTQPIKLPSADDILIAAADAIGSKKAASINTLVMKGTIEGTSKGQKWTGVTESYTKKPDKLLSLHKFSNGNTSRYIYSGERGWVTSSVMETKEITAQQMEFYKRNLAISSVDIDLIKKYYPKIKVVGKEQFDNKNLLVLELTTLDDKVERLYFDTSSKLPYRWDFGYSTVMSQQGITFSTEIYIEDYVDVNGFKYPMTIRQKSLGDTIITRFDVVEIKYNVPIDDKLFKKP